MRGFSRRQTDEWLASRGVGCIDAFQRRNNPSIFFIDALGQFIQDFVEDHYRLGVA